MRFTITVLSLLASVTADAQLYQCTTGGRTSFQDRPCDKASVSRSIALQPAARSPQAIFAALRQGMSVDEVRRAVPGVRPGNLDRLATGAVAQLQIPQVNHAGSPFTVGLFFLGDRLSRVNFSGRMGLDNQDNLNTFDRIVADFRSAYGQENARTVANRGGLSANAEWQMPRGKVWVSIIPITADTSLLNFGFVPGI